MKGESFKDFQKRIRQTVDGAAKENFLREAFGEDEISISTRKSIYPNSLQRPSIYRAMEAYANHRVERYANNKILKFKNLD